MPNKQRLSLANGAQRGEVWASREGEAFPPRGGVGCGAFSDVCGLREVRVFVNIMIQLIQTLKVHARATFQATWVAEL